MLSRLAGQAIQLGFVHGGLLKCHQEDLSLAIITLQRTSIKPLTLFPQEPKYLKATKITIVFQTTLTPLMPYMKREIPMEL